MSYGTRVALDVPFAEAVEQVRAALAGQGSERSLLPCNVVVRAAAEGAVVEALDPQVMVTMTGRPELKPVAGAVSRRLAAALPELSPREA